HALVGHRVLLVDVVPSQVVDAEHDGRHSAHRLRISTNSRDSTRATDLEGWQVPVEDGRGNDRQDFNFGGPRDASTWSPSTPTGRRSNRSQPPAAELADVLLPAAARDARRHPYAEHSLAGETGRRSPQQPSVLALVARISS